MYPNQGGFQPPSFQHTQSQGSHYTGPPPAKKPKGNPIITRYPPPPGYTGPAQPQAPFQPPAWSRPGQPYSYGQPSYPSYPQHPHNAPQPYQQPQWPGYQQQTYPSTSYAPQPSYYQGYAAPPAWQYPNSGSQSTAPQPWQPPTAAPQSAPPQPWQPPGPTFQQNKRRHNSAPYPHVRNGSIGPVDGNGDPFPPQQAIPGGADDLEDDFDGECYFARHPDEIDPAFSLGLIEWQAPLPTKRALPSTFQEAELEALAPRKPPPTDEECISDYFMGTRREEVFLSVRQTDMWEEVKDDPIFKEFPVVCDEILSMSELLERYRDRPDPNWERLPMYASTSSAGGSRAPTPLEDGPNGDAMDIDGETTSSVRIKSEEYDRGDVLGNLEQALLSTEGTNRLDYAHSTNDGGHHSRAASVSSQAGEKITRPKPLAPVRDPAQEDILAALGVTGSPKMVYQTPGPAFGPALSTREGSVSSMSRHNSITSKPGGLRVPPPPPPHQRSSSYDPWAQDHQQHPNANGYERPGSSASQHTAAGSDFHDDDNQATPRPQLNRMDSRKRAFDEHENGAFDDGWRMDDDATPKQRRKQQRVDDAYSRRW